jgi:hypothetical protein
MSKTERTKSTESRIGTVKRVIRRTPGIVTPDRIHELLQQVQQQDHSWRVSLQNGHPVSLNTADLSSKSS